MTKVKYVAHRGLSMFAPENTIPAFELAAHRGMWGIECDTYCTVDGRWIVHHDRTVDRMTNGTGKVETFTYEEIRNLNIVSGNNIDQFPNLKVPSLEEVLLVCKNNSLYAFVEIELFHRDTDLETLVRLVDSLEMMDRCSFICFQAESLRKVREIHKGVRLGFLTDKDVDTKHIELAMSLGNTFLDYLSTKLDSNHIGRIHKEGIEVSAWTVNTRAEALSLIQAGVDYITTDTVLHEL